MIEVKDLPFWFQNVDLEEFAKEVYPNEENVLCSFVRDARTGEVFLTVYFPEFEDGMAFKAFQEVGDIDPIGQVWNGDLIWLGEPDEYTDSIDWFEDEVETFNKEHRLKTSYPGFFQYMIKVNEGRTLNGETYLQSFIEYYKDNIERTKQVRCGAAEDKIREAKAQASKDKETLDKFIKLLEETKTEEPSK